MTAKNKDFKVRFIKLVGGSLKHTVIHREDDNGSLKKPKKE